jgi:hypothetical protein
MGIEAKYLKLYYSIFFFSGAGSGSVSVWASRTLPSTSKKISYRLLNYFLLFLKTDVNVQFVQ